MSTTAKFMARVEVMGTFSGFTYEDRRDIYSYLSGLDYQSEHEGDILIDPIEAGIILEMEYRGLLKDKPMWRYNRKGSHRDWQEKQKLPGMGEREVTGVKSTYSLDPMNKEPMPQYNNPKIVGYRVEMGREEQRITPFLIASSDVAFGVGDSQRRADGLATAQRGEVAGPTPETLITECDR